VTPALDKSPRKGLSFRFPVRVHLISPGRSRNRRCVHILRSQRLRVAAVEHVPYVSFIGDERRRLQRADLMGFAQRGHDGQRRVERRNAFGIEAPPIKLRAPARKRLAGVNRVERAVELFLISQGSTQACTPASTASTYSSTSSPRPWRTSCIAVWPENPGSGCERHQA
jgi:hypothetical protein